MKSVLSLEKWIWSCTDLTEVASKSALDRSSGPNRVCVRPDPPNHHSVMFFGPGESQDDPRMIIVHELSVSAVHAAYPSLGALSAPPAITQAR